MTEQRRIKRERHKRRSKESEATILSNDSTLVAETKQSIDRMDEAFDDIIAQRTTATSVIAGEQERHSLIKMSDEELVKKFRQKGGE